MIGSAVFNITLVIAVCALAATQVFVLNWYSVVRDCFCYLVSIIILLCTIANGQVSWMESLFFLIVYVLYCVGMAFNSQIEAFAKSKIPVPVSWDQPHQAGEGGGGGGEVFTGAREGGTGYGQVSQDAKKNGNLRVRLRTWRLRLRFILRQSRQHGDDC